ncbi:MAG: dihydrolipoamide acetyltransferase family protein [Thermoplasmatales archaeon]
MPQMGESVTEATVSKWFVKVGDHVKRDQPLLEISTDKVDSEVPSPADGYVKEILVKEGETVPVKTVIMLLSSESPAASEGHSEPRAEGLKDSFTVDSKKTAAEESQSLGRESSQEGKHFLSPVVREMLRDLGIPESEAKLIKGSGAGGRVTKGDVMKYAQTRQAAQQSAAQEHQRALADGKADGQSDAVGTALTQPSGYSGVRSGQSSATVTRSGAVSVEQLFKVDETQISPALLKQLVDNQFEVVAMDVMRRSIADHMVRSKSTSPHVYSIIEVDCSKISKFRAKTKEEFQRREGFSLSFTPFFLEACVKGILEFPILNTSVDGYNIIYKKHVHLGVAVALGNTGLIVPVIKRAEEKSFLGLCRALNDLAQRARSKKLSPDEVAGGTFTVTNPGVFGTLIGTPIINQPQVAILCLGAIVKKPAVVEGDAIAVREMCYLTLSYDHRVIDGAVSGQFLSFVKNYLENWDLNRDIFL